MTFDEYAKYRLIETFLSWGVWVLVFGCIGIIKLALFIREVRRNHRAFERMRKKLMEGIEDDDG